MKKKKDISFSTWSDAVSEHKYEIFCDSFMSNEFSKAYKAAYLYEEPENVNAPRINNFGRITNHRRSFGAEHFYDITGWEELEYDTYTKYNFGIRTYDEDWNVTFRISDGFENDLYIRHQKNGQIVYNRNMPKVALKTSKTFIKFIINEICRHTQLSLKK